MILTLTVRSFVFGVFCFLFAFSAIEVFGQSLRGSSASLDRQNRQAREHDFTVLRDSAQLKRFVGLELLVPVQADNDFALKDVSFPYARPEVRLFIDRLSSQYRKACGERLVVTSLTRPRTHQPRNASPRSVHPTGMALDLRRPRSGSCRQWLERVLLSLEKQRVLEATLEHRPPHFHIAIFPDAYRQYVSRITSKSSSRLATYTVQRRDTLWDIARDYGTTPSAIRRENGLRSTVIRPGQRLRMPAE